MSRSAASTVAPTTPIVGGDETSPAPPTNRVGWPKSTSAALAGVLYLGLAFALWWHAWSGSPSGVMTCDCTDAGRMVWYLEWIPFALGHGHSLLFSTFQFHPRGFNLLADTSVPALALALSPVTVLFGPVLAMNLASTLIPAATAFSMYWLLRRWVRWAPAAFVGGLAYGFSAWVVVQLTFGWINMACLALLPLMAACLDELLIRQRRRPATVGVALALLLVCEFFVSIEIALLASISVLVATVLVVTYGWVTDRAQVTAKAGHAAIGITTAGVLAALLLAYPVGFFVAGPAHLSGSVWTSNVPGELGNTIGNLWDPVGHWGPINSRLLADEARTLGGFPGKPGPSPSYLGWGFLAVLAAGVILWRSDRRLWLFGTLGAVCVALSLAVGPHHWGPWSILYHLPILLNVVQYRFAAIFVTCAAVMLGIILDRAHASANGWLAGRSASDRGTDRAGRRAIFMAPAVSAVVALAIAAVALVPEIGVLAPNLPVTMQPVRVPRWFLTDAPRLPGGSVLATYPFPSADSQAAIPWQAITGMPYQMAGGGGPAGTVPRAGKDTVGFNVLRQASVVTLPPPTLDLANLVAVRHALRDWGVTMVVVPDDNGLRVFQTGRGTAYGVAFFTAVLGSAPVRADGAWVWPNLQAARPDAPVAISTAALDACIRYPSANGVADRWAHCVLSYSVLPERDAGEALPAVR